MAHVVHTGSGRVRGMPEEGVLAFRGIPYAQPPVGPLRFRPPQKPVAWRGVREAFTYGPAAMQVGNPMATQTDGVPPEVSEDCLSLNVWTPAADDVRRPVLVWLHGGAAVVGTGSRPLYNGARLAARGDVVVVTLNYRLGLFGFLRGRGGCGDALESTGNESVLDQIAALEWVRDEIGGFGGDPVNVTVFGQSHGARCAALLTIMPRARGLVHKVIQQSGSFSWGPPAAGGASHPAAFGNLDFPLTPEVADAVMRRVLDAAGLSPAQAGQLRDWPAADLLALQSHVTPRTSGVFYRPVADGDLIPADPFTAVAAGASRGIALLCGTNLDEMKFFRAMAPGLDTLDEAGLLACCRALRPGAGEAERVIETYRAAWQARGADTSPPELWFAIAGDHAYRHPVMHQAERHAAHTLEIPFVFGHLDDPGMGPLTGQGDAVQRLSAQMMDAWIAFARTGHPATAALPAWPAYTADRRATMVFDESVTVVDAPLEAERAVWASVSWPPWHQLGLPFEPTSHAQRLEQALDPEHLLIRFRTYREYPTEAQARWRISELLEVGFRPRRVVPCSRLIPTWSINCSIARAIALASPDAKASSQDCSTVPALAHPADQH
ncbi:MAG: carboxylesterase/lipase family protein, partial [Acidobacteria bacterium]